MNKAIEELKAELKKKNRPKKKSRENLLSKIINTNMPESLVYYISFHSFLSEK